MAFCDFCTCEACRTGVEPNMVLKHAPTADGRWICYVCWRYDECVEGTRRQLPNGKWTNDGPCEDEHGRPIADCPHRPELVGPWTTLKEDQDNGS